MQRDSCAYLNDIVEACEAVGQALTGIDLAAYSANRLVRSAVEREFIIARHDAPVLHAECAALLEDLTR